VTNCSWVTSARERSRIVQCSAKPEQQWNDPDPHAAQRDVPGIRVMPVELCLCLLERRALGFIQSPSSAERRRSWDS
jgi:hypothetical protein